MKGVQSASQPKEWGEISVTKHTPEALKRLKKIKTLIIKFLKPEHFNSGEVVTYQFQGAQIIFPIDVREAKVIHLKSWRKIFT